MRIALLIGLLLPATLVSQIAPGPPVQLIDMHMHIWEPLPVEAAERDALLSAFQEVHIVKAVASGAAPHVFQLIALDSTHILGGVVFSQDVRLPSLQQLRRHYGTHRLAVLGEIDAQYAGVRLDASWLEPYWALSETLDIPAAVHTGFAQPGTAYDACCRGYRTALGNPQLLEPVLAHHPKLRVYLMHAGWPYLQETKAIMHMYPHVYADLAGFAFNPGIPRAEFYGYLSDLLRAGLGKRLMFGSGLSPTDWSRDIGTAIALINEAPFLTS